MIKRGLAYLFAAVAVAAIALSAASADEHRRYRAKQSHHARSVSAPQSQWYVGEYPFPYLSVVNETYSRCRVGWWQSSHLGHPRPQWATYCQR